MRVNAFVSGGFLKQVAPKRVGVKLDGFIHICDYYTTLAALAGVDHVDHRAALAKLPPVDGLNMAPWILGLAPDSPRTEVWNDLGVLIVGKYKLYNASGPYGMLTGGPNGEMTENHACFPGEIYPNGTGLPGGAGAPAEGRDCNRTDLKHVPSCQPGYGQCEQTQTCPGGACLYNIFEDPTEHHQLSDDPKMAPTIAMMRSRLAALEATYFNPVRNSPAGQGVAARVAQEKWGGYWGPFVFP